eukprot:1353880-Pyramimonas_sp.AAC.1
MPQIQRYGKTNRSISTGNQKNAELAHIPSSVAAVAGDSTGVQVSKGQALQAEMVGGDNSREYNLTSTVEAEGATEGEEKESVAALVERLRRDAAEASFGADSTKSKGEDIWMSELQRDLAARLEESLREQEARSKNNMSAGAIADELDAHGEESLLTQEARSEVEVSTGGSNSSGGSRSGNQAGDSTLPAESKVRGSGEALHWNLTVISVTEEQGSVEETLGDTEWMDDEQTNEGKALDEEGTEAPELMGLLASSGSKEEVEGGNNSERNGNGRTDRGDRYASKANSAGLPRIGSIAHLRGKPATSEGNKRKKKMPQVVDSRAFDREGNPVDGEWTLQGMRVEDKRPGKSASAFQILVCSGSYVDGWVRWALSGRWEGISARAEKAAADRGEIDQKMPLPVEKVLRALRQKGALKQWIKEHCTE